MSQTTRATDRTVEIVATGVTVLVWYALPDVVRNRSARAAVRTLLLGVTGLGGAVILPSLPEAQAEPRMPVLDAPKPALLALAGAGLLGTTAATVWFERAIFARGERRRTQGVRWAHTRPAIPLALVSAAVIAWAIHPSRSR